MKKLITVLCLVLVAMLSVTACAETVKRQVNVDMESVLSECTLNVGFETADITDNEIYATIYDTVLFDIVDINSLKVGDTIVGAEELVVESIENVDGAVLINGGDEEGGMTLYTEEDTNGFMQVEWGMPVVVAVGQAQLVYGDQVTLSVYKHDSDLSPVGEGYDTETLSAAEVGAKLKELTMSFYGSLSPYQARVTLGAEEQHITEITIDYAP